MGKSKLKSNLSVDGETKIYYERLIYSKIDQSALLAQELLNIVSV